MPTLSNKLDQVRYLTKKSDSYLKNKQYSNAMAYYYHILRISGLTASGLLSNETEDKYRLNALRCIAFIYFSTKQYEKCVDKCNLILSLITNSSIKDYKTLYFRGISYYNLQKQCEALQDLTQVYQQYPTNNTRKLMNKLQIELLKQIDSYKQLNNTNHYNTSSQQIDSYNRSNININTTNICLYKVVQMKYTNKCLIATTNIAKGSIILTDTPLIVYDNDKDQNIAQQNVLKAYYSLNDDKKIEYDTLYSRDWIFCRKNKIIEIANTNAIMLSDDVTDSRNTTGVFPLISRINHSCARNVHWIWKEKENRVLLIASRDIVCGEELLTSYLGSQLFSNLESTKERREYLLFHYGFYCECDLCLNINEKECVERENIHKEWNTMCNRLLKSTTQSIGSIEELRMALKFVNLSKKYYRCFGERLIISYEQLCARLIARKQYNDAFKYFKKVLIEKALYNGYMDIDNINLEQIDSEVMSWIELFPAAFQIKINHLLKCTLNDVF